MAATSNKNAYAASAAMTCGIVSLATASARQSTAVDNTTNLYIDALVSILFTQASNAGTNSNAIVNVYAYGSEDGTNYGTPATGSDGSLGALATPTNLRLIGTIFVATTSSSGERTYVSEPLSVASGFSGVLPPKWGVVVENQIGTVFSSSTTSTANKVSYTGVYTTSGN